MSLIFSIANTSLIFLGFSKDRWHQLLPSTGQREEKDAPTLPQKASQSHWIRGRSAHRSKQSTFPNAPSSLFRPAGTGVSGSRLKISHVPKLLTKEEMLELFKMIAVDGREDIVKDDRYLKLGVQMLEKIQGLPLAVVTLAGILRTKRHLNEWKRINEACSSNILIEDAGLKYGAVRARLVRFQRNEESV